MSDAGATWTDERVELLKKLWAEGLSASRIANEIGGVSRNAVIGKVHRLGLSGRAKEKGSSVPRPRKPASAPAAAPVAATAARKPAVVRPAFPRPAARPVSVAGPARGIPIEEFDGVDGRAFDPTVLPECERVTIMELRDSMCRWPLGDPVTPEFRFCGSDAVLGLPYCPYHCSIAYQPAQERRHRKTGTG